MGEVITNLKARFSAESNDMAKGLKPGKDALGDLDKQVGKTISGLGSMLSPIALLAGAGGAFAVLKSSIESVEGPGDKLEATMGGVKESLFEAGRAIATLDFTNFLSNLEEGFERGEKFAIMLDELADKSAYNDYKINQLKRESEQLQEIVKDKTLELSVRAEAAEKVKQIEEKIRDRRIELAQEEFDISRGQWEKRNKMEATEAVRIYELVDNMAPELKDRLQKAFEGSTSAQMGNIKKGIQSVLLGLSYDQTLVKEVPRETLESYAEYFKLVQTGERDVLKKLFNTFKQIDEVGYKAQADYNGTVAQTTKLLAQEEKQADKTAEAHAKLMEAQAARFSAQQSTPIKADISNLNLPQVASQVDDVLAPIPRIHKAIKSVAIDMSDSLTTALDEMAAGLGEFLGQLMTGEGGIDDFGNMVGGVMADLAINVGKIAIQTGIAALGIQQALALNPALAIAAGAALVALGYAVKSSLKSAASGGGAGGSMAASSAGGGFTYDARNKNEDIKINITGKLTAEGGDLVYVFDKAVNKKEMIVGRGRGR